MFPRNKLAAQRDLLSSSTPMACLLALVVAAAVLTAGPPGKLTRAARTTSPAEAFWRAALPGAPMPEAIRELLRPGAAGAGTDDATRPKYHDHDADAPDFGYDYADARHKHHAADPPPLSFSYDDARPNKNHDADPPPLSFSYDDARPNKNHDDADPPPLSFSYDVARPKHHDGGGDDDSSPRNEAAAPSAEVLMMNRVAAGARRNAAAAASPKVFFLEDAVRVGGVLPIGIMLPRPDTADAAASPPLRLYTVRAVRAVDGCRFVVCRRADRDAGAAAGAGPDDGDNNDNDDVYACRAATTGPARAYVVGMVGERGETATAAVVCRNGSDDTSRWSNRARAALWLLDDVKPGVGGGAAGAAICHAAVGAQVIPVKNDRCS